jgi:hypothetical protein
MQTEHTKEHWPHTWRYGALGAEPAVDLGLELEHRGLGQ